MGNIYIKTPPKKGKKGWEHLRNNLVYSVFFFFSFLLFFHPSSSHLFSFSPYIYLYTLLTRYFFNHLWKHILRIFSFPSISYLPLLDTQSNLTMHLLLNSNQAIISSINIPTLVPRRMPRVVSKPRKRASIEKKIDKIKHLLM